MRKKAAVYPLELDTTYMPLALVARTSPFTEDFLLKLGNEDKDLNLIDEDGNKYFPARQGMVFCTIVPEAFARIMRLKKISFRKICNIQESYYKKE